MLQHSRENTVNNIMLIYIRTVHTYMVLQYPILIYVGEKSNANWVYCVYSREDMVPIEVYRMS